MKRHLILTRSLRTLRYLGSISALPREYLPGSLNAPAIQATHCFVGIIFSIHWAFTIMFRIPAKSFVQPLSTLIKRTWFVLEWPWKSCPPLVPWVLDTPSLGLAPSWLWCWLRADTIGQETHTQPWQNWRCWMFPFGTQEDWEPLMNLDYKLKSCQTL